MNISRKIITSFYSLQNEGLTIGTPCYVIYFAGCNLSCSYCDSKKASRCKIDDLKDFNVKDLNIPDTCDRIIFSGGEPTLQPLKEIIGEIESYYNRNFIYELETNGTNILSNELLVKINLFNINLKLSGTQEIKQLESARFRSLDWWINNKKALSYLILRFKFVVDNDDHLNEVLEIVNKYNIPRNLIILIRQGLTIESFIKNPFNSKVIEFCKTYGFTYSPRLHIFKLGST